MRNTIIYTLILIVIIITISAIINGIEMNNTYGQYGKEIFKPSTFIIATMLSIWLITKLLQLLKSKKQDTNEITSLTSTHDKIITNPPSTKPSWFKQGINFLTFDTPTFRSVFDEGQRRVALVISFIIPFISSYVLRKDWEEGYIDYDDDFIGYYLISYLMYFVILLIYIWIREGSGNVRPSGNASKSLWNMAKIGVISFLMVAVCGISYEEYNKKQEEKRIDEDKAVVIEKTEKLASCIFTENIECITDLVVEYKKNEIRNGMLNSFKDCDFKNASLKNASVQRKWNNQWNYKLSGKVEYNIRCSKKGAFEQVLNNITVQYDTELKIIDIKIGD